MLVSGNKAWHQRNTSQNIADPADVKAGLVAAARRVIQHRDSIALHDRVWRDADRLKGAEKNQGQPRCATSPKAVSPDKLIPTDSWN